MFRPKTSTVAALSSFVANGLQAIHFVSSAPSIHSVRRVFPSTAGSQPAKSGPSPWLPTRLTAPSRALGHWHLSRRLYPLARPSPYSRAHSTRRLTHRPLAPGRLFCPPPYRYYGLIRASEGPPPIYSFIFAGRSDSQKVPNLLCQTFGSVPRSLRRWLQRLSRRCRHRWPGLRPIGRGSATTFIHAPDYAWWSYGAATFASCCGPDSCWPCSGQDVYDRAFMGWVAPTHVGYDYLGKSSCPGPDFHRPVWQPYGLHTKFDQPFFFQRRLLRFRK